MIKVFKLISGEELISKCEGMDNNDYMLDSPASIMMQRTEQGVGVGLAPYMPYSSGKIKLHAGSIAASADVDVKMENEYNRLFGSGIQIAPAGSIAGL
ncbi:hypothetical protein UFOVP240_146 [uncultured Caudovirales phage]|uniref:Uncharacterized protein n=1 Tax=uncultured Caudovirales phage TaxID=2100421 RepID=A0A6J7WUB7_9CAUD|nr:hypothetical protein UFOVP240_146 [uncultured Caudovirales phage]